MSMALERRGKWWYADSADDLDEYLLEQVLGRHQKGRPHHVVHARCAECNHTAFDLYGDESSRILRICTACKAQHAVCDPAGDLDMDSTGEIACTCCYTEVEVAVGYAHALVRTSDEKTGRDERVPAPRYVYVAGRCTHCGCSGVYGEWRVRRFHTLAEMDAAV
jgi:hypothetical protein